MSYAVNPDKGSDNFPSTWRMVCLSQVTEPRTGTRDPSAEPEKAFRYVDITSVDNQTKRVLEAKALLGKDAPSRARQVMQAGDVLVATTRPNLNAVAIVPHDLDGQICSTGFCVLRPTAELDSEYLFAFVQSPGFVSALSELVRGALYPAVTDKQVKAQRIPLPSPPEQKRIAAVLRGNMEVVARARASVQQQLEALGALPIALLRRTFERRP